MRIAVTAAPSNEESKMRRSDDPRVCPHPGSSGRPTKQRWTAPGRADRRGDRPARGRGRSARLGRDAVGLDSSALDQLGHGHPHAHTWHHRHDAGSVDEHDGPRHHRSHHDRSDHPAAAHDDSDDDRAAPDDHGDRSDHRAYDDERAGDDYGDAVTA